MKNKNIALLVPLLIVATVLAASFALGTPTAHGAPLSVLTVDCTPLVSPGFSSFGPQNTIGMALQAADLGGDFVVTEDTPAAFRARSAASLAAFDLIAINNHPVRLGDGCVQGAGAGLGTTWQGVIGINTGGRVLLTSHDAPRFHMNAPAGSLFFGAGSPGPGIEPFGAPDLVRQAALWAGGGSNTGLLIFNDSPGFAGGFGWDNAELNLPAAWGITDLPQFVGAIGDGGYTDILPAFAGHPVYAGLSDGRFAVNTISSFSANIGDASFETIFGSFNPAIFTVTEAVINAGIVDVGGFDVGALQAAFGPDGSPITLIRDELKPAVPLDQGRMTGGGSVFTEDNVRVRHGFTLHCKVEALPNNLEVNWQGNSFHLESLVFAVCTDDPNIDPHPPTANFDTHEGAGTGRYNGVSGATAEWTFTDAGQPGRRDVAAIRVFDAGGDLVLAVVNNFVPRQPPGPHGPA